MIKWIFIFYLLLFLAPVGLGKPITVGPHPIQPQFHSDVTYFYDQERLFDLDQRGVLTQTFLPGERADRIEVGYSSGILWGRFQIEQGRTTPQNLIVSFHHLYLSRVRIFEVIHGELREIGRQGGGFARSEQSFGGLGTHVPLRWVEPGLHEYVMGVEAGGGHLGLAFTVSTAASFVDEIAFPQFFGKGAFFGTLFTLLIFHCFVFISTRDRSYALYVCYIASVILLFANLDGVLDRFLPQAEMGGWGSLTSGCAGLVIALIMLVNKVYFESRKRFPRIDKLFNSAFVLGLLMVFATPWVPVILINRFFDLVATFSICMVFGTSFYIWRAGYEPAKYLFLGRLAFTVLAAVFMLHLNGFFPDSFIINYSLQIGCLCDLFLSSYGLGERMRVLEIERTEAREGERQASFKLNWFNTLVRVITHDLSTPVSVVTASADLELRRSQPSSSLLKNLERIARASRQQTNLINHVRDMLAVASGKKELELKPVCLNEALEEAISSLMELADQKQIRLDLVRPHYPVHVAADVTALVNTVLDNFLSNAIKFSEPGSSVRLVLESNPDFALVHIIDSGIGIPDDLIDHLFDPAHATSRPGTAKEVGTGFGLPLAKAYIEQFHGRILVESRTEKVGDKPRGTCFTLELPILLIEQKIPA